METCKNPPMYSMKYTSAPFYYRLTPILALKSNSMPSNCGKKLLIHSQNSTVAPLKFVMEK